MSTLHSSLQDYLALRRGLGFKMNDAGRMLPGFVSFLEERHELSITAQSALEWAQHADVQPAEWARRLGFVRGFARYCSAVYPLTEVPASELLPHRSTRARPYLYSEEEVQRLLAAALQLPTDRSSSALRPWTFHCLLGLLSVTGLRISEALDLKLSDVDLQQAVPTIHAAKLGRSRLVPLHPTTCAVLAEYMRRRQDFLGLRDSIYLFVSTRGTYNWHLVARNGFQRRAAVLEPRGTEPTASPDGHRLVLHRNPERRHAWHQGSPECGPARLGQAVLADRATSESGQRRRRSKRAV